MLLQLGFESNIRFLLPVWDDDVYGWAGFSFSSSWAKGIGVGWVAGRIVFDAWVVVGMAEL